MTNRGFCSRTDGTHDDGCAQLNEIDPPPSRQSWYENGRGVHADPVVIEPSPDLCPRCGGVVGADDCEDCGWKP